MSDAWPRKCSHGIGFGPGERCDECKIVSLTESLKWMERQVTRDRRQLDELLARRVVSAGEKP